MADAIPAQRDDCPSRIPEPCRESAGAGRDRQRKVRVSRCPGSGSDVERSRVDRGHQGAAVGNLPQPAASGRQGQVCEEQSAHRERVPGVELREPLRDHRAFLGPPLPPAGLRRQVAETPREAYRSSTRTIVVRTATLTRWLFCSLKESIYSFKNTVSSISTNFCT